MENETVVEDAAFEHLQKAYVVERNGEEVIVPVNQLSDEEIEAKIAELKKIGNEALGHADELSYYKNERI